MQQSKTEISQGGGVGWVYYYKLKLSPEKKCHKEARVLRLVNKYFDRISNRMEEKQVVTTNLFNK